MPFKKLPTQQQPGQQPEQEPVQQGHLAGHSTLVLVPGLFTPGFVLFPLCFHLRKRGYRVEVFNYRPRRFPVNEQARLLGRYIEELQVPDVSLIAHSYGGLVSARLLELLPLKVGHCRIRSVLLLGTPLRGSALSRQLRQSRFGVLWQHVLGFHVVQALNPDASAVSLHAESGLAVESDVTLGIMAGTRKLGLTHLLFKQAGDGDGIVAVTETAASEVTHSVEISHSHAGMLFSTQVFALIVHFLRFNRFEPAHLSVPNGSSE